MWVNEIVHYKKIFVFSKVGSAFVKFFLVGLLTALTSHVSIELYESSQEKSAYR